MFSTISSSCVFSLLTSSILLLVLSGCDATISGAGESGVCGDSILDFREQCDDGNTVPGDGCSEVCLFDTMPVSSRCGDGVMAGGEDCDDGNTLSGDGCDDTCHIEVVCGNGRVDSGEECDDGNPRDGDGCDANCKREGRCGDGDQDTGEECDDGNQAANDGCDIDCKIEVVECGNGSLDPGESCDDSNQENFDGCSEQCQVERCGDGVLQPGEECDDGNIASGDGCTELCFANEGLCVAQYLATCNSSDTWSTMDFGSTDNVDGYSCNSFEETGREYTYRFQPEDETKMTIGLLPDDGLDLDIFVLTDDGEELCKGSTCSAYGDDTATVIFPAGGTYWIVVDGYKGDEGGYTIDFDCPDVAPNQCSDSVGDNGDSCADVYQGQDIWRCTISPGLNDATVSQVCRDSGNGAVWQTFHVSPTECCACDGEFDVGCCAENSGSAGCP